MSYSVLVKPGEKVDLARFDTKQSGGMDKLTGEAKIKELGTRIEQLQELLYAAGTHSLLIVLQGMDTAGKDGAIKSILGHTNVQSTRVVPFKVPSAQELAHDFLWRIHRETPSLGAITIFNRSQYEDVLVVRVHNLAPRAVIEARYGLINDFERLLSASNTIILKFCLLISKEEQAERLRAREADPEKAWKLSVGDWKERERWEDYRAAYQDALEKCSTQTAPWRIIPAERKWFRDLAIAEAIVEALAPFENGWRSHLEEIGRVAKAEIDAFRASTAGETGASG